MKTEIEQALAPLSGRALTGAGRSGGMLQLQFGERQGGASGRNGAGGGGGFALHVSCTWRLATDDGILTGSGDYFTPADPDADPDGFDWEAPGANWCDVRLRALVGAIGAEPPRVTSIAADSVGGLTLGFADGLTLAVFPDSSDTEHVETEFWRFLEPGDVAPQFIVSSEGVGHVAEDGDG